MPCDENRGKRIFEKYSCQPGSSIDTHEHWNYTKIQNRLPFYEMRKYGPPRLMNDPEFGDPTGGSIVGGVFSPPPDISVILNSPPKTFRTQQNPMAHNSDSTAKLLRFLFPATGLKA